MTTFDVAGAIRDLGFDELAVEGGPGWATAVVMARLALGLGTGAVDTELETALRVVFEQDHCEPRSGMVVRGYVRNPSGRGVAGKRVEVFDRDMRREQSLGIATTDERGRYEVTYNQKQFARGEKRRADLVVRTASTPPIASPILFNAPTAAIVNLPIGPFVVQSEFARVGADVGPVLEGVAPETTTDADLQFVAREVGGLAVVWLRAYRIAHDLLGTASASVPDCVYACIRQRIAGDGPTLLLPKDDTIRAAIDAAIATATIDAISSAVVERFLVMLRSARIETVADGGQVPNSAARLLALAVPNSAARRLLVTYEHDAADRDAAWAAISSDPTLKRSLDRIRLVRTLAGMTGDNDVLVEHLITQTQRPLQTTADLARWSHDELVAAAREANVEDPVLQARVLERLLDDLEPTARISAGLSRGTREEQREVAAFLDANPDLVLGRAGASKYAAEHGANLSTAGRALLGGVVRLARLTPRYNDLELLIDAGLTSAFRLARGSKESIALALGEPLDSPTAAYIHGAATKELGKISFAGRWFSNEILNDAIPPTVPIDGPQPELAKLFGSFDYCACDECQAADGPAAYLVDLLHQLDTKGIGKANARDVFKTRRGEIEVLPLSCYNTLTPIPYIDLVNEVLEAAVDKKPLAIDSKEYTADELRLRPQARSATAYHTLAGLAYPWGATIELGREAARATLLALSTTRFELLVALGLFDAWECFGIPAVEQKVFAGPTTSAIDGPKLPLATNLAAVIVETGLSAADALALLRATPFDSSVVVVGDVPSSCDTAAIPVTFANEAALVMLGRLVRFARRSGWPIASIAIAAGARARDPDWTLLVEDLARIAGWARRYGVPFDEARGWLALGSVDRGAAIARATGLPAVEVAGGEAWLGAPATVGELDLQLTTLTRLAEAEISTEDARWLVGDTTSRSAATPQQIGAFLHEICVGLFEVGKRVAIDTQQPTNTAGVFTGAIDAAAARRMLGQLFDPDEVDIVIAQLDETIPDWTAIGLATTDDRAVALAAAAAQPKATRPGPGEIAQPVIFERLANDVIEQLLTRETNLSRTQVAELLAIGDTRARFRSLGTADPKTDVVLSPSDPLVLAYQRIERAATVVVRFGLSEPEVKAMLATPPAGWLEYDDLGTAKTGGLDRLLNVAELARTRRAIVPAVELLGAAGLPKLPDWSGIAARLGFAAPLTVDATVRIARTERALAALELTWAEVAPALQDASPDAELDAVIANGALAIAADRRVAAMRDIYDSLREKQRDALVASLLGANGADPNSLFTTYLIDTQMSSCALTSRVKFAIGSVQLFMQRCLMNLETDITLSPGSATWWRWMQSYRLWQANRKIFLYPENWIEPELRRDKSPQFVVFEEALSQLALNDDVADDAFRGYLTDLHEVASLEVMSLHFEASDQYGRVLHLIARRFAQPRTYYYRQRLGQTRWTAWEQVDADIDGDVVMLTVHNGRPTIVWPSIRVQNQATGAGAPPAQCEIRFSWMTRTRAQWGKKQVSEPAAPLLSDHFDSEAFRFVAVSTAATATQPSRLTVDVFHANVFEATKGSDQDALFHGTVVLGACDAAVEVPTTLPHDQLYKWPPLSVASLSEFAEGLYAARDLLGETRLAVKTAGPDTVLLDKTDRYLITHEEQTPGFVATDSFVFQDRTRTYLVEIADRPTKLADGLIAIDGDGVEKLKALIGANLDTPQPLRLEVEGRSSSAAQRVIQNVLAGSQVQDDAQPPPPTPPPTTPAVAKGFRFSTLQHLHACELLEGAETESLADLLAVEYQLRQPASSYFHDRYVPRKENVIAPDPVEGLDFSRAGAFGEYNWELFFHAPFMLAVRLMQAEQYEAAIDKFHLIFNPTRGATSVDGGVERFWQFAPFRALTTAPSIGSLLTALVEGTAGPTAAAEIEEQLAAYRDEPFDPHAIAKLRPNAYMRAVVMRYLDCLIAWGDQLFRKLTLETLNEATLLYIRAADILGSRPQQVPKETGASASAPTFQSIEATLDAVELDLDNAYATTTGVTPTASQPNWSIFDTLHFCVPPNPNILAYWDTVADRLFKLRHCQDIDGAVIQLPLFEPPIDPALLVRAASLGVDIGSALDSIDVPLPAYRFTVVIQKALELAIDLKSLGTELERIFEKRDAEALALLRGGQEIVMLDAARAVRKAQVDDADRQVRALERQRETVDLRRAHYQEELQPLNANEASSQRLSKYSADLTYTRNVLEVVAGICNALPTMTTGTTGFNINWGTPNLGAAFEAAGRSVGVLATHAGAKASAASVQASYDRRSEEWSIQGRMAASELKQLDEQLVSAQIRLAIAERELENHDRQRENARAVDSMMRAKFTNLELFDWMARQASMAYHQAYRLAFDMARRAERCYQHERAAFDRKFIGGVEWDYLRRGLLSGMQLHQELRQMEVAYLDDNRRDHEITKNISLAQISGLKLLELRLLGKTSIELSEPLFDHDYPGHYMRRIKSVALTIPAIVGPYTSVNARLTLEKSSTRVAPNGDVKSLKTIYDGMTSIVTSSGQNDSGTFESNLRDERYLPFEGAGAISTWTLEILDTNTFDRMTISDLVLHVKFEARSSNTYVPKPAPLDSTLVLSARHDLSTAWSRFTTPDAASSPASLVLDLSRFQVKAIKTLILYPVGSSKLTSISSPSGVTWDTDTTTMVGVTLYKVAAASNNQWTTQWSLPGTLEDVLIVAAR